MGRLILPLKGVWYDSIESLEKPEEYREITPYWVSRFVDGEYTYVMPPINKSEYDQLEYERRIYNFFLKSKAGRKFFNSFDELEFTKGYPKKGDTNRRMIKQSPMIDMGYGISELGAMPDRLYFIVTWDLFGDLRSHFIKSPYRKVIIEDMYPNSYDSSKSLYANTINFLNKIRRDKRENELRIELIEKKQK